MDVQKVFVGVHGIGDQTEFETIQNIIEKVTTYQGRTMHIPLGKISSASNSIKIYECHNSVSPTASIGFAEVYWADITRKVAAQGYVLEESTRWAGSLVEKLDRVYGNPLAPADKEAIAFIFPEAIESLRVVKRLSKVVEWGGKIKFDLDGLLKDYLGDVQFVTEFDHIRAEILQRFRSTMSTVWENNNSSECYIVAHSEGTVVAFLGLLEAMSADEAPHWLKNVKGFMTIGSPIDKHLILWPELWAPMKVTWHPEEKIFWHNYFDFGDPVGFELDAARSWLGSDSPFTFNKDVGYARYFLPGKAHVDYWHDNALFGEFLQDAGIERHSAAPAVPKLMSRNLAGALSCLFPYLLSFGLLVAGVFIFYNTILSCIVEEAGTITMLRDSLAFSALVAGIGVAARIPRLVRDFRWHLWSMFLAGLFFITFWCLIDPDVCTWLAEPLGLTALPSRMTVLLIALVILLSSYLYNFFSNRTGVWFMVAAGSLSAMSLVLSNIIIDADHKTMLPVLFGAAAFLYLWWLSVLLFDLTFIWHQYIRNSLALHRMQDCFYGRYRQPIVSRCIAPAKNFVASGVARGANMIGNTAAFAKKIMPQRKSASAASRADS